MQVKNINTKLILTTQKNNITKLLIILMCITLIGYLIFRYFQPYCEPCIPKTYCPPCRSKEQYITQYTTIIIDIFIFIKILVLKFKKNR
jgi:hypothetical protein